MEKCLYKPCTNEAVQHGYCSTDCMVDDNPNKPNNVIGNARQCGKTDMTAKLVDEFINQVEEKTHSAKEFLKHQKEASFHPIEKASYYNRGTIETIDFIEDHNLGNHAATAIIYIDRAGNKPGSSELDDLRKAVWWLKRRIKLLEKSQSLN